MRPLLRPGLSPRRSSTRAIPRASDVPSSPGDHDAFPRDLSARELHLAMEAVALEPWRALASAQI